MTRDSTRLLWWGEIFSEKLIKSALTGRFLITSYKFHKSQNALLQKYSFDQKYDARVTIFSKCIVAIDSLCIALLFLQYSLVDKEWWNKIWCNELGLSSVPDEQSLEMMRNGFSQFLVVGFFQSFFSAIESAFRIYLRELDPIACNNGTADFEAIYNCLLKKLNLQ